MADCSVYPGTSHDWWSYTPAGYTPGTPLPTLFFCDGAGYLSEDGACRATIVLDNLISSGDIPPTCACFISPGTLHDPRPETNQRGYEYDSITPQFAEFLLADVIPAMVSIDLLASCSRALVAPPLPPSSCLLPPLVIYLVGVCCCFSNKPWRAAHRPQRQGSQSQRTLSGGGLLV